MKFLSSAETAKNGISPNVPYAATARRDVSSMLFDRQDMEHSRDGGEALPNSQGEEGSCHSAGIFAA